ncbi:hypothetical protein CR513_43869, partial [Mucuna pruriens]
VPQICIINRPTQSAPTPPIFWGQPFSEEIDYTPILANFRELTPMPIYKLSKPKCILVGNDALNCKLFPSTLGGVAMQWLSGLVRTIRTFSELATLFISQFAANKAKRLEVTNLFDIKQMKDENLKFNNSTVQVNNLDQNFFFQGLPKGTTCQPIQRLVSIKKIVHHGRNKSLDKKQEADNKRTRLGLSWPGPRPAMNQTNKRSRGREAERKKQVETTPQRLLSSSLPYPEATLWGKFGIDKRDPVICFTNEDYEGTPPHQDDPMVISLIVVDYKIERVLIDQGSFANVLHWPTFQKLGLSTFCLEECSGTLFGFVGEQVEIRGMMEIKILFGVGASVRSIPVTYIVVNTWAFYNMIIGCPTLNRL